MQEAIVSSTILYASEVTYRGQATLERSVQRSINRIARSTLGVMQSTPIPFLMENAGSMPAGQRLRARQKAFAVRTVASESAEIRKVGMRRGPLAERIRGLAEEQGIGVAGRPGGKLGGVRAARDLLFPGEIRFPTREAADTPKDERHQEAIEEARRWENDPYTLWTDGSAFPSGVAAAAVVGYVEPRPGEIEPEQVTISSTGGLRAMARNNRKKQRNSRTYNMMTRSVIRCDRAGGFRSESWSLGARSTAFDTEIQALVRAIEICALDARKGASFRIFTDSQAAMSRIQDDSPGPGQSLASRGIRVARAGIYDKGATVSIQWVPGHREVTGNELADACARNEAERAEKLRGASNNSEGIRRRENENVSLAFVKSQARKEANKEWREMIRGLNRAGGRTRYKRRNEGIPRIPETLKKAPKAVASRFFQLASGHTMIAPFLQEKFGWVESDLCWWCTKNTRQTREHLFKECST